MLLGTPTADSSRLYAQTVTSGDPAWAGALAGVGLGLPVYHITEDVVKSQIAPADCAEHLGLLEMVIDVGEIGRAVRSIREGAREPRGMVSSGPDNGK